MFRKTLKYSLFLLLWTVLTGHLTYGQTKLDSLEKTLKSSLSDSVRFVTLMRLSGDYQYVNFSKAEQYANEALALSEKNKGWTWSKAKAYSRLGFLATLSGDYTSAIKYDNLNLQWVVSQNDSVMMSESLNNLGNDYNDLGRFDEAYYYFTQSYRVGVKINDSLRMAIAMHNIGTVLNELGQYDLALNHFNAAQNISDKINDLDGRAYTLNETAEVYLKKKDYKRAEQLLKDALVSIRERKLVIIESRAFRNLARLHFDLKDYDRSLIYYDSAIQLYKKNSNEFGEAETNLGVSEVYTELERFDEAQRLIEESLETAKSFNAKKMEIQCYQQLSLLAEKKGDFKNALAHHKKFKETEDKLFSQEMIEKLFQDQLRFRTEAKDSEITILNKEKAQQDSELRRQELVQNILVVAVALTLFLLFTVYRSGRRRIRINKLLIEHQEEIKKRSIELEQLNQVKDKFFSIISHDLRSPINALSAILDLISKKQVTPEEFVLLTQELKVQFNHTRTLINNLLDWALLQMDKLKIQPDKINLTELVDENFKLLSSLHTKEINFVNNVPKQAIGFADLNMINLVFRNLILNGIKFSESGSTIEVSATEEKDKHIIAIKDQGVGIHPAVQQILFAKTSGYSTRGTANEKGTGLGLILCKEFVERNGGTIWLDSEEGKGSTFFFTIKKA